MPSYLTNGGSLYEREHYFWVYTDFYKWSLISQVRDSDRGGGDHGRVE